MKIACDKCLKIESSDRLKDWLKVRIDHSEFWLCPHCAKNVGSSGRLKRRKQKNDWKRH